MRVISKFLVVLSASSALFFVPAIANASPAAHPTVGYHTKPAITYYGSPTIGYQAKSPAIGYHTSSPGIGYYTGTPGIGYYG